MIPLTCLDGLWAEPARGIGSSCCDGAGVPWVVAGCAVAAEVLACEAAALDLDGILTGRLVELPSAGFGFARFRGPMVK